MWAGRSDPQIRPIRKNFKLGSKLCSNLLRGGSVWIHIVQEIGKTSLIGV